MELMQEKGYSDHSREEEEELREEEEELLAETSNRESSSKQKQYYPLSSSSPSNLWLGMLHPHHHHPLSPEATTPTCESHNSSSSSGLLGLHHQEYAPHNSNSNSSRKLDLMDLSLGNKDDVDEASNFHATNSSANDPVQKEHMFDKVVTPSDVGKLNRLVIPKQYAERFFPLDSTTNDKGLLLNFEDRTGKLWRFRYSYWNSSQSYVMTKGWSRFVKEKKLDAGDIVSFQRGMGELYRHRLYIDWRRRPDHAAHAGVGVGGLDHHQFHHRHSAALITPLLLPSNQYSVRWGGRLYPLPAPTQPANYHNYPFQQRQHQLYGGSHGGSYNELNFGSGSLYYYRSPAPGDRNLREGGSNVAPMIIDSVPVAHGNSGSGGSGGGGKTSDSGGKRLRLFGVNMECSSSSSSASSSLPSPNNVQYLREAHEEEEDQNTGRFGDQKGETSVLFDLNPSSFQHRQ